MSAREPLVLVADDEKDLLDLACMGLEDAGFEVARASNGTDALRLARERHPDVCVLDVHMPGMLGHEVLRALREEKETEGIPVVLTTQTMSERALWRLGPSPDDCLRKSSIVELEERLRPLLERRSQTGAADDRR